MGEKLSFPAIDVGFLPAACEVDWELNIFLQKSTEIAQKHGFPAWKSHEVAIGLQGIFYRKMKDKKEFDVILQELNQLVASICEKNP